MRGANLPAFQVGLNAVDLPDEPMIRCQRWSRVLLAVSTCATLAASCRSRTTTGLSAPPVVTVIAREYAFDAPDSIPAGPTTFKLVSHGREQHFVGIEKIDSAHTLADFKATLTSSVVEPWVTSVGGVGTIEPGDSAMTTINLEPGLYALMCDMTDAHGTPHMLEGMLRALHVTGTPNEARMPREDVQLDLTDYAFALPDTLSAGTHVIAVKNLGPQTHMALLWRLHQGKTGPDVVRWLDTPTDSGPPPVTLIGGTPDLAVGRSVQLDVQLEPGRYLLICLVGDAQRGQAHYEHGMYREIVVRPGR